MSQLGAARLGDPVGHGLGMAGLIAGAVVGALAGAAFLAGTAVTGGALAAAAIGAGALAGGALSGQALARGLGTLFGAGTPTSGALVSGSPDVFVNGRPAVRAGVDHVAECSGLYGTHHGTTAEVPAAEGSATVRVNGRPMARVSSRLACAAAVTAGSPDVFVGGPSEAALPVVDHEQIATQVFAALGLAAAGAGALAAATVGAAALGGYVLLGAAGTAGAAALDRVGRWLGPGWGDILQGGAGLMLLLGPAAVRARGSAAQRAAAEAAAEARAAEARAAEQRAAGRGFTLSSSNASAGVEPASPELLAAVGRRRTVAYAAPGSDDEAYLNWIGAEANVGGPNMDHILLRPGPSKAAVLEEFLHGTQRKLGIVSGTHDMAAAEYHVKDFMVRHRRLLGLSDADVERLTLLRDAGL